MKIYIRFCFSLFLLLPFLGCAPKNPYQFIEKRDGLSVYLDNRKGAIIYIDETNRIIDYTNLKPTFNDITTIENNKNQALKITERGKKDMPGTGYSVSLSTRFYGNHLFYSMDLEPYDDKARRFANGISFELQDLYGFSLGEINSLSDWITSVDDTGKEVKLQTEGNIPITLGNYLEIAQWSPRWARQ